MNQENANFLAYLALFGWPIVVWILFYKLRPIHATFISIFGALMFLPMLTVDPPALPPLNKASISTLAVTAALFASQRPRLHVAGLFRGADIFVVALILGGLGTALTNADSIVTAQTLRQNLTFYDFVSQFFLDSLRLYLPFLIGRTVCRTPTDVRQLLWALTVGAVIYMPLCLFEFRFSPQLHTWIYGYFPSVFYQSVRGLGYRPSVFMGHGLVVARFMLVAVIAAAALSKSRFRGSAFLPTGVAFGLSCVGLLLCQTMGAFILAAIALPLIFWATPRTQIRVAIVLSTIVFLFPMLRQNGLFPTDTLVELSEKVSLERAASLEFRFHNEDVLLEHARRRWMFGWGGYGRNRVYDETYGEDITVTDGEWIIVLGINGIVGMVSTFAVYLYPILVASRRLSRIPSARDRTLLGALALTVAIITVDLLPNSGGVFPHAFFSGVLYGVAIGLPQAAAAAARRRAAAAVEERSAQSAT